MFVFRWKWRSTCSDHASFSSLLHHWHILLRILHCKWKRGQSVSYSPRPRIVRVDRQSRSHKTDPSCDKGRNRRDPERVLWFRISELGKLSALLLVSSFCFGVIDAHPWRGINTPALWQTPTSLFDHLDWSCSSKHETDIRRRCSRDTGRVHYGDRSSNSHSSDSNDCHGYQIWQDWSTITHSDSVEPFLCRLSDADVKFFCFHFINRIPLH
ncbi:hypothetical protein BLNAU_15842 [Blattamonas nauphoetae]|uniref:Uncharacterized protein n=1 Tax=Blattamonas nauphoetae TaxID=2049346 RepID=A0ABQ9XEH3_9EUKA|nr:hypothetical protein BLNAU_15842 [Blattamonas nauphoetae]